MTDFSDRPRCEFHGGVMSPAWAGDGRYWSAPCCPLVIPQEAFAVRRWGADA